MRKVLIIVIAIIVSLPVIADQTAITEDGRKVLLKDDGTWEYITSEATTWHPIVAFEGNSIKDTQTFNVQSKEWRIRWATSPGTFGPMNFQIYIYNDNGDLVGLAANVIGEASDVSYMRGAGSYYLTINAAQKYKIVVEEKY